MKNISIFILSLFLSISGWTQTPGKVINLNGQWDFDQTTNAFPPQQFTRKCPVPGLIHLAKPHIAEYDKLFKRPEQALADKDHDYRKLAKIG